MLSCSLRIGLAAIPLLSLLSGVQAQTRGNVVTAQEFAPGVISTGKGFTVAFAPDGKTVYFTARELNSTAAKPPLHVYESHLQNGQWQIAKPVSFSSAQWSDLDPFITDDGQRMFFVSTRPAPGKASSKPDMDIWVSE